MLFRQRALPFVRHHDVGLNRRGFGNAARKLWLKPWVKKLPIGSFCMGANGFAWTTVEIGATKNTRKVYGDLPGDLLGPIIYRAFWETGNGPSSIHEQFYKFPKWSLTKASTVFKFRFITSIWKCCFDLHSAKYAGSFESGICQLGCNDVIS